MGSSKKKIEAIVALPGQKRYSHFIKTIADREEVWGLYLDGWALAVTGDGDEVFPMWPAKEFADICARNEWINYEATHFSLDELMDELLPNLKNDNVLPGVFYTPEEKGVTPSVDQLLSDLKEELEAY